MSQLAFVSQYLQSSADETLSLFALVVLDPLLPRLPALLRLFATLGFFGGASLLLALALDLSRVLAFPFYSCYFAAALVYRWSLVSLSALFNVFRGQFFLLSPSIRSTSLTSPYSTVGKKYNPLRARTEPASYSMDTLLLGTILFVTLIFLFPTIVAFYMAFSSVSTCLVSSRTNRAIDNWFHSFPVEIDACGHSNRFHHCDSGAQLVPTIRSHAPGEKSAEVTWFVPRGVLGKMTG